MHAVIISVELDPARSDEATDLLNQVVVPTVKQSAGFVSASWLRSADKSQGRGVLVFDTEENAKAVADQARQRAGADAPTTFRAADFFEVIAQA